MNNPYVTKKNNKTETVAGSDPWDMWFFNNRHRFDGSGLCY